MKTRQKQVQLGSKVMVSRENTKSNHVRENLQLLRSITKSHAVDTTSIIVDASKYIEELKEKVERLNQDMMNDHEFHHLHQNTSPVVTVKSAGRGFLIHVYSKTSYPCLLVSILEAFERLNIGVTEARVACENYFQLEALGNQVEEASGQSVDAQMVREAVLQAINIEMRKK